MTRAELATAYFAGRRDFSQVCFRGVVFGPGVFWKLNFRGADFRGADFRGADFQDADFQDADFQHAKNIPVLVAARLMVAPPEGEVIGWKKCRDGAIVKLLIPADAARSNATGRKCRASKALVLEVIGAKASVSLHDRRFIYRKGETVLPDSWSDDRWQECAGGIHFYITREEAEAHV